MYDFLVSNPCNNGYGAELTHLLHEYFLDIMVIVLNIDTKLLLPQCCNTTVIILCVVHVYDILWVIVAMAISDLDNRTQLGSMQVCGLLLQLLIFDI